MHICISISIHSVQSRFTMYQYTSMHTHICTHVSDARAIYIMQIDFAEVKVLQQQNMLNVHHMHTWVCTVFKWNYEQHLYTHTLIPIINRFASTNEPLSFAMIKSLVSLKFGSDKKSRVKSDSHKWIVTCLYWFNLSANINLSYTIQCDWYYFYLCAKILSIT